jgi:hypothetical protein
MTDTTIKPAARVKNDAALADISRANKEAAETSAKQEAAIESVVVAVRAARTALEGPTDPDSLVASIASAIGGGDSVVAAHGGIDPSRVKDLLSDD